MPSSNGRAAVLDRIGSQVNLDALYATWNTLDDEVCAFGETLDAIGEALDAFGETLDVFCETWNAFGFSWNAIVVKTIAFQ
jgi:hypothetical protein